jgi:hypothetical protein
MDAVKGKFKPLAKSTPQDVDFSFGHALIIFIIIMVLIYIISRNNNSGGGGRYDDDDDVIITRRGRKVYPGGFPIPNRWWIWRSEVEVLAEVLVASEVAEVSAEVALLADGRKDRRCDCKERSIIKQFSNNIKSYQIISNNTKVKKQPKIFRLLFF